MISSSKGRLKNTMYFHRLSLGFNFKREMNIIEIGIYIPELKILTADMKIFFHGLSNKLRKKSVNLKIDTGSYPN